MFTSDNFVREGMRDVDIEAGEAQRDLDCLRFSGDDYNGSGNEGVCTLPPLLFTPASPVAERGRGFDHAISRGNTRPRAFSHSPQPTHIRHPDTLHRSSDAASISQTSALYGGYAGAYGTPPQDDIDFHSMHSFMDTPSIHEHVQHEPFAQYGPREEVSPPEGASSSLSPPSSVFSTHSSPGYFPHELPHATGSRSDYAPPGATTVATTTLTQMGVAPQSTKYIRASARTPGTRERSPRHIRTTRTHSYTAAAPTPTTPPAFSPLSGARRHRAHRAACQTCLSSPHRIWAGVWEEVRSRSRSWRASSAAPARSGASVPRPRRPTRPATNAPGANASAYTPRSRAAGSTTATGAASASSHARIRALRAAGCPLLHPQAHSEVLTQTRTTPPAHTHNQARHTRSLRHLLPHWSAARCC
ncbi:hypothetical protein B0H15DRAFT_488229 [Mycena belliarum]|uniref:Uncharacterized protein n=1 Tax=Mycena belliarum TaxID=1033014 RepID=A0AAD6TUK6_9AGAR|nr:hypothetical protein B0H15DRAFT_488229 [Mycena belliae]